MPVEIIQSFVVGLALAASLLAVGVWAYPRLKKDKQGYVFEIEIEEVILPLIAGAVNMLHQYISDKLREAEAVDLTAEQKRALFAELYRLVVPVNLKPFITVEQWSAWGQAVYDEARREMIDFREHFDEKIDEWNEEAWAELVQSEGDAMQAFQNDR